MKRFLILLITIMTFSLLNLTACTSDSDLDPNPTKKPQTETPSSPVISQPLPVEDTRKIEVDVMSEMYGAKGDGVTSDRAAIQLAIDEVAQAGGGTVMLTAGHTFLSGNLIMRSNVTLRFGDGAVLLQNSDPSDYIEVRGYDYGDGFVEVGEHYMPIVGIQLLPKDDVIWPESTGNWRECWYWNYPLIYGENLQNVTICGNGTIQSMHFNWQDNSDFIYMHMLGFYKCTNVSLSDLVINHEGSHCCNFVMCNNATISGIKMWTPSSTAENLSQTATICDGLKLDCCQDFLIENSWFCGGDDSLLIMTTYGDVRKDRWSSGKEVQPTKNIEISNCYFPSYYKGLGFAALGNACPDFSQIEISDIYIHDCHFCSVGVWSDHRGWLNIPTLESYGEYTPIKSVRWENNDFEYWSSDYNHSIEQQSIQNSMLSYPISDQISDDPRLHSMSKMMNGDFEYAGIGYWVTATENGSIAECRVDKNGNHYGFLGDLEKGSAAMYEGIYVKNGKRTVTATIRTGNSAKARLFIKDQNNVLLASTEIENLNDWTTVTLQIDLPGSMLLGQNCRIGIESLGESGWIEVDNFTYK